MHEVEVVLFKICYSCFGGEVRRRVTTLERIGECPGEKNLKA